MNKLFLATVLVTGAIVTKPATASVTPCTPYPSCCAFEENPWQCAACPILVHVHDGSGPITIYGDGDIATAPNALGIPPIADCAASETG